MIVRALPVLALLSALFVIQPAKAQDPLGGAVLGVGLDNFANKLQSTIQQAIGGGLILEVGAGGQVSLAITQAKTTYEADLNLTYDKLNAAERNTVNSLSSLLTDFENKTYKDVADVEGRAAGIVHALPFSSSLPRLYSYDPVYTPVKPGSMILVSFAGDFSDLMRSGLEAYIFLKGQSFSSSTKSNNDISFSIPFDLFDRNPKMPVGNVLTVHIPYRQSCYLMLKCTQTAEFRVPLSVLPANAGTIAINYKTTHPGTDTRSFTCPEQIQESVDDDIKCGGEHGDIAVHKCNPDPGYTLDPNTVSFHMNWSQGQQGRGGDWWLESNCSSPTTACLCFSTEHHRAGTSGKVHFNMTFQESKPINVDVPGTQTKTFNWGDNQVIELPVGATWTGTYTRFDGKQVSFAGPFVDPYIRISPNANVINIRTVP